MKWILLSLIAVFVSTLSVNAQKEGDLVLSATGLKNITLGDDMTVVLINAKDDQNAARLSAQVMEKLNVNFSSGRMDISPRRALRNETVYLLVDDVNEMTLGFNTRLTSEDIMNAKEIALFVNYGAAAALKTKGKIKAYAIGETNLEVKRSPILLMASAPIE